MKVTVNEKPKSEERKYPWIGITENGGDIVLFISPKTGVSLSEAIGSWEVGYWCDTWLEERFIPFAGEITLSND